MEFVFDDASYSRFLKEKKTINNPRLREDDQTFFDAMISKEADLRTSPEGKKIIQYIQSIGNE